MRGELGKDVVVWEGDRNIVIYAFVVGDDWAGGGLGMTRRGGKNSVHQRRVLVSHGGT